MAACTALQLRPRSRPAAAATAPQTGAPVGRRRADRHSRPHALNHVLLSHGVGVGIVAGAGADEGLVYIDRDTADERIRIDNGATGVITATAGPAIGIEVLLADGRDDLEDIGSQDPLNLFPNVIINNDAGGVIENTDAGSGSNSDAINIGGNEGATGDFNRPCAEGSFFAPDVITATNCVINLTLNNDGTIETASTSGSNAGLTIEDDALFRGTINNSATGVITGARNGIRIADIVIPVENSDDIVRDAMGNPLDADGNITSESDDFVDLAETPVLDADGNQIMVELEHTGTLNNDGTISGTGTSGRGIDLEGDGVRINNAGTISGTSIGIEVGDGSNSGENNVIFNLGGTISGGSSSIDADGASGEIRIFNRLGGTFDGDIRGSDLGTNDFIAFQSGVSTLADDILLGFLVRNGRASTISFTGNNTIEGDLFNLGTLEFDIANTINVTGDLNLTGVTRISLLDATGVAVDGNQFTLATVGGTLTNNARSTNISDSSLLLDFDFVADPNDLIVEAFLAGTGGPSAAISSFDTTPRTVTSSGISASQTSTTAIVFDPGSDSTTTVDAGVVLTVAGDTASNTDPDNGVIVLDGTNNNATIINNGTLISDNINDENVAIFVDNSIDNVVVENSSTGLIQGTNGVIFFEGDAASLDNAGVIEGTGVASEGVVYFDRDADANPNTVINSGTITSIGGGAIVVDTLLGTVGGEDPQNATANGAPVTFSGNANIAITNSGTIENTAAMGETAAILFDGAPGNTSEGSLEIDRPEEFAEVTAAFPAGTDGIDPTDGNLNSDSEINPRRCRENITGSADQQINCLVNLDLDNSGSITSTAGSAILNANDAALIGTIDNAANGIISGITGLEISGAHVDHDLDITNAGTITGTDGDGLLITGNGVDVVNLGTGTISGADAGLQVEGSTFVTQENTRSALNLSLIHI